MTEASHTAILSGKVGLLGTRQAAKFRGPNLAFSNSPGPWVVSDI